MFVAQFGKLNIVITIDKVSQFMLDTRAFLNWKIMGGTLIAQHEHDQCKHLSADSISAIADMQENLAPEISEELVHQSKLLSGKKVKGSIVLAIMRLLALDCLAGSADTRANLDTHTSSILVKAHAVEDSNSNALYIFSLCHLHSLSLSFAHSREIALLKNTVEFPEHLMLDARTGL